MPKVSLKDLGNLTEGDAGLREQRGPCGKFPLVLSETEGLEPAIRARSFVCDFMLSDDFSDALIGFQNSAFELS